MVYLQFTQTPNDTTGSLVKNINANLGDPCLRKRLVLMNDEF